jgi:hypothetical protein
VHIGLPRGRHIRELLVNSDKIFTGFEGSNSYDSPQDEKRDAESYIPVDAKGFIEGLKTLLNSKETLSNMKKLGETIPYDKNVETLQTALQILGFSLPMWGVDGKFGNETEKAVSSFQKSIGNEETGIADPELIKNIIYKTAEMVIKNVDVYKNVQK